MRVVIAEDSVLLREGLARLLGENGFDVVDTCQTADDLLLKVRGRARALEYVEVGLAMKLLADSAERTGYLLKDRISPEIEAEYGPQCTERVVPRRRSVFSPIPKRPFVRASSRFVETKASAIATSSGKRDGASTYGHTRARFPWRSDDFSGPVEDVRARPCPR